MKSFKTFCDFRGVDFEADGPQLHEKVRVEMAKIYPIEDFGPEEVDKQNPLHKTLASKGA